MIVPRAAFLHGDDVHAVAFEFLEVLIQLLAVGINPQTVEAFRDILERQAVLIVSFFFKDLLEVKHFQLLVGSFCHTDPLL